MITLQVDLIRKEHYGTLRGLRPQGDGSIIDIFSVTENSPLVGQSLRDIDLRGRSGVTLIAVVRDGKPFHNVVSEFVLEAGDRLVLLGDHKALDDAARMISPENPA